MPFVTLMPPTPWMEISIHFLFFYFGFPNLLIVTTFYQQQIVAQIKPWETFSLKWISREVSNITVLSKPGRRSYQALLLWYLMFIIIYVYLFICLFYDTLTTVADAFLPGPALRPLHQERGGEGRRDVHLRGQERGGQVPCCCLPPGQHWPASHDIQVSILQSSPDHCSDSCC